MGPIVNYVRENKCIRATSPTRRRQRARHAAWIRAGAAITLLLAALASAEVALILITTPAVILAAPAAPPTPAQYTCSFF